MKILYVTTNDVPGQQFNGYLLKKHLALLGHDVHMSLANSITNSREVIDPNLHVEGRGIIKYFNFLSLEIEKRLSLHAVMPLQASTMFHQQYYQEADIVHLQLPHTVSWFSIFHVMKMSRDKKVFWTMHDPWLMTGHCIHPLDCERWKTGCGKCPYLDIPVRIRYDNTAFTWKMKRYILRRSSVHLIVASKWMHERVKASPLLNPFPCSLIPFGIDLEVFKPRGKRQSRLAIGIPPDAHVISFRYDHKYGFKGLEHIENALASFEPKRETYLVSIGGYSKLEKLRNKYKIIQMGSLENPILVSTVLNASDIFLSPSNAEAFGLMPVEAMACATPVIVFEGTALPEVVHAPDGGIAVPYQDSNALRDAIGMLLSDQDIYQRVAKAGLEIAREAYPLDRYVQRHLKLYSSVLS